MKFNISYYENQSKFISNNIDATSSFLVFIGKNTDISLDDFNVNGIKVFGARFPHLICNGKIYEDGLICIEISENFDIEFIKKIIDHDFSIKSYSNTKSIMTILDGFCKNNENFLSKLFENVDVNTNIIGGGAGILDNSSDSILFDNDGFYRNAAILISLESNIKIGVKHGWEYLDGPFIVTSSEKNILKTIDYIDAFDYYKHIIKKDCNVELTKDNFLEVSQNYPIGIIKYQGEQIVRDPITFQNGNIELLGEITNNSMINILKGNRNNLLEASKLASSEARCKDSDLLVMFNCISRKKFLGDDFQIEIDSIYAKQKDKQMIGVTTLGEIANNGNRYINFLNKTCVIGGICN